MVCICLNMTTQKDVIKGDFVRHKPTRKTGSKQQYKHLNLCLLLSVLSILGPAYHRMALTFLARTLSNVVLKKMTF